MEEKDINESFCEKILQNQKNNKNIKVFEIKKSLATALGDNYASQIYRILVKYEESENVSAETSLIIKMKLPNLNSEANAIDTVFHNETIMLRDILPKLEKYIDCLIGPFFYHGSESNNYIIMEDLSKIGYNIVDKYKGFSFEESLKVIEKIAKLHAASVAIAEKDPHLLETYRSATIYNTLPKTYFKYLECNFINTSNTIEERWKEDEYQEIARKLKITADNIEQKILDVFKLDTDEFCVLNHGDCWINNMMIQHDEKGKPCDARLIDFQMITYTSPAIDLIQFLSMGPDLKTRGDNDEYFLQTYLTILTNTMKEKGCKKNPPTMEQLKKSIRKRGIYSILAGMIYYPRILADKNDVETIAEIVKTGSTKLDHFKVPAAAELIRKLAKINYDRGHFDYI